MSLQQPTLANPALNVAEFNQKLERALEALEQRMWDVVASEVNVLQDASRHILGAGGKRVRPRLLFLAYTAMGGAHLEETLDLSAALELIHTASIVHDDINDHGVVRRGRPSVNAKWGRTFALLTGDYLFTKVFELIGRYGELNPILSSATTALVEGETLQAAAVKNHEFTREIYFRIINLKTAALFRAAAKLGAVMAGASREQAEALANFGNNIGLSFQIIDDVLDVTSSTEQLGKTSGIDVAQGRGVAVAFEDSDAHVGEVDPMLSIRAHILNGKTLEEAIFQARRLVEEAIEQIAFLPSSPAKDALINLAHSVTDRTN
ncbi:MAG: polyprenyl synthetase family protein [Anaerolineae bacterium]|nr:polyprenyl synthetase family protein [Anaerolineae bacterium]